jgi:cupin fold WbuC family metalloprotein
MKRSSSIGFVLFVTSRIAAIHSNHPEPIHRMLNAFEPGTYVRPHKHESPDKFEMLILLTGKALAPRFDDSGAILEYAILDNARGICGVEFAPREWHTVIPFASGTVLFEVNEGSYSPTSDKNFAPWAPEEGSSESIAYIASILDRLGMTSE